MSAMHANDAANLGFEVKASSVQRCAKMFAKGESKLLPALQGVGGPDVPQSPQPNVMRRGCRAMHKLNGCA